MIDPKPASDKLPGLRPTRRCAVAGVLACLVAVSVSGGEKFKITDSPDQVQLPKDQELRSGPTMDSKITGGESSQGPILPPPNAAPVRNPKLDELIDRKKNWIYDSPNALDRDQALQEIYGVRKYDLDGWEKKPKSQSEKYFDSKEARKPGSAKNGTNSSSAGSESPYDRAARDRGARLDNREEPQAAESAGIIQALNPAPLFNWDTSPESGQRLGGAVSRGSTIPRGFAEAPFGQRPFAQPTSPVNNRSPREYERSWDNRKSPVFGRIGDPINDSPDQTRTIMNPISARKASVAAPEIAESRTGGSPSPFTGNTPAVSMRPDYFTPSTKPFSAPNISSPVSAPASSPILSPKPAILEIPRPKF